ncbi:SMC-Scp complex subunit ScpB [Candidatus Uhrbacteria bacterium]|nr:SMC-Scp complex subunit ScpB [Candidatus Uhrbacteria bacterium]
MALEHLIESVLFVSSKPLSYKKIAEIAGVKEKDIVAILPSLQEKYSLQSSGIVLVRGTDALQLTTNPDLSKTMQEYLKEEFMGELTRPALETLSVVAYRGPVARHDIEHIRGVNCSQSLRNLLIRGLIEVSGERGGEKCYSLAFDFIRLLGITSVHDLPDFESLSKHEKIDALLTEPVSNPMSSQHSV